MTGAVEISPDWDDDQWMVDGWAWFRARDDDGPLLVRVKQEYFDALMDRVEDTFYVVKIALALELAKPEIDAAEVEVDPEIGRCMTIVPLPG